jgi:hypothetical protein
MDAVLISQGEGGYQGFHAGFKNLAAGLYLPGLPFIFPVEVKRPDSDYFTVLDVNLDAIGIFGDATAREPFHHRSLIFRHFKHLDILNETRKGKLSECRICYAII